MLEHLKTLIDIGCWLVVGLIVVIVLLGLIYDRVGHVKKAIEDKE